MPQHRQGFSSREIDRFPVDIYKRKPYNSYYVSYTLPVIGAIVFAKNPRARALGASFKAFGGPALDAAAVYPAGVCTTPQGFPGSISSASSTSRGRAFGRICNRRCVRRAGERRLSSSVVRRLK